MNDLIQIEQISTNALEVFAGESDTLDLLLKQIETEALSLVPDVTTKKGRDAIASNAYKVSQAKSRIEREGKALADKQKEIPKLIDASRKKSKDFLDALQARIKKPLTDWEAEQYRIKAEALFIARIEAEKAEAERVYLLNWEEALIMNDRFEVEKEKAAIKAAQDKAEAERVAKEKAEQDEKDRLAREEEIKRQAIAEAEARQKAAIEKAEADKKAAEQAARDAIENARIEKEQSELRARQEAELAEARRLQAVEDERKRVADEAAKQKAIDDARQSDIKHRTEIKSNVKTLLIDAGLSEDQAVNVVKLACAGKLGAMTINF